ncbi:hypothetical protein ACRRTK_023277 [Alexandromys fortis]
MTPRHIQEWKIICLQFVAQTVALIVARFDVEKECSKIDEDYKEKTIVNNKAHLSKIETKLDTAEPITTRATSLGGHSTFNTTLAEFVSGLPITNLPFSRRSLSALPTVSAYNNRAQAEIRLQRWSSALHNCEKALELEPGNIKALLRRATTYKHQNKLQEAREDLQTVLRVEPHNDVAKKTLSEVESELKKAEPASEPQTKGKRMVIEEIENSGDEGEDGGADTAASSAMGNIQKKLLGRSEGGRRSRRGRIPQPRAEQPGGPRETEPASSTEDTHPGEPRASQDPSDLKSRGNELFRSGQFAEAASQYSAAIAQLEPAGSESADELSILYSNRAACYFKEGNCSGCVQDCNRALELHPFSVKPLLRRATAYETLEQYGKAYVDYKTVLQIDRGIQLASSSVNRITKILMEQDGPKWRENLPPIPTVPPSEPLRVWHPAAETPDQEPHPSGCPPGITGCRKLGLSSVQCGSWGVGVGALCYLKLGRFEEAKLDCDQALQIDGGNEKACYRLALAQKGLENCQESLADPRQPDPGEAKTGLQEATRCPDAENGTASPSKGRERRRIQVQEVNESSDEEPERPAEASAASLPAEEGVGDGGSAERSKNLEVSRPSNAYEFGQVLHTICTQKDAEACAQLLAITAPRDLPVLLSNKLESDMLLLLIQSLKSHLVAKDPALVYEHLLYLSRAERFKVSSNTPRRSLAWGWVALSSQDCPLFQMTLTLINQGQKEQMAQLLDSLSHARADRFTAEDVQALRRQYGL